MIRVSLSLLGALLATGVPAFSGPLTYYFQSVSNPNDTAFTQLLGINNAGTIAGYWGDGTVVANHGFTLVLPNSFTPENYPSAAQTQVVGINNTGDSAGFWVDGAGVNHGFTLNGGTFTSVDNPNTTTVTQLLGINDGGTAAGYWTDGAGNFHPFTFFGGAFTPISFLGLVSSQATSINNAGDVAGFNMPTGTTSDGFLDIGGAFTTLDFPGSSFTQALGLNNLGQVAGTYTDNAGMHGFIYTVATGTYQSVDDPNGIGTTIINGINDRGQIVGFYVDANNNTIGFVGTTAPEPGSLFLLLLGITTTVTLRRWIPRE